MAKAVTAGFVSGFDDGTFRPNNKITRQEAAVILARIIPTYGYSAGRAGLPITGPLRTGHTLCQSVRERLHSGYTDGMIHPLDSLPERRQQDYQRYRTKETIVTSDPVVKGRTKLSGRIYSTM